MISILKKVVKDNYAEVWYVVVKNEENEQQVFLSVKERALLTAIGRVYARRGGEGTQTLQSV